jgi:hypothetical protein
MIGSCSNADANVVKTWLLATLSRQTSSPGLLMTGGIPRRSGETSFLVHPVRVRLR